MNTTVCDLVPFNLLSSWSSDLWLGHGYDTIKIVSLQWFITINYIYYNTFLFFYILKLESGLRKPAKNVSYGISIYKYFRVLPLTLFWIGFFMDIWWMGEGGITPPCSPHVVASSFNVSSSSPKLLWKSWSNCSWSFIEINFLFWCSSHCYFLLKSKDCFSKKKTKKPFYFIKYTMKIRKFFCNAKTSKKFLQSNDFSRLKKNKKPIFSVEIAQNPAKNLK